MEEQQTPRPYGTEDVNQAQEPVPVDGVTPAGAESAAEAPSLQDATLAAARREAMRVAAEEARRRPPRRRSDGPERPRRPREADAPYDDDEAEWDGRRWRRRGRRARRLRRKLIVTLVVLVLLVAAVMILWPRVRASLTPALNITVPEQLEGLLPDEELGYSKIDFSNAVLGKSIEQRKLIVLKQEVTVTSQVSQALANISLFEKTKVIRSHGTGQYTVDLMDMAADDVDVDLDACTVTISIPHAVLDAVYVDVDKTEFEDTKKALFAFGDIKMTPEQKQILEQSIDEAMRAELTSDAMFCKADEQAVYQVRAMYQKVVEAVSPEFVVKVVIKPA